MTSSEEASLPGTSSLGRGSLRSASARSCALYWLLAACSYRASCSIFAIVRLPMPERLAASLRSASISSSSRSARIASFTNVLTTSWSLAAAMAARTAAASSGSLVGYRHPTTLRGRELSPSGDGGSHVLLVPHAYAASSSGQRPGHTRGGRRYWRYWFLTQGERGGNGGKKREGGLSGLSFPLSAHNAP